VARTHDAAHAALCIAAVTEWNRPGHNRGWSPIIGAALAAKFYFPRCLWHSMWHRLDQHPQNLEAQLPQLPSHLLHLRGFPCGSRPR
jgi:hypothetical protein